MRQVALLLVLAAVGGALAAFGAYVVSDDSGGGSGAVVSRPAASPSHASVAAPSATPGVSPQTPSPAPLVESGPLPASVQDALNEVRGPLSGGIPVGGGAEVPQTPDAPALPASGGVGVGGSGPGSLLPIPRLADRRIIRSAVLEVVVEDVEISVHEVESIAATAGGYVAQSSIFVESSGQPVAPSPSTQPRRTETAIIDIRVPVDSYQSVVDRLRAMSIEVTSERSQSTEVTEDFIDLEARLRNLQGTESRYLELLGSAVTIPDILSMEDRLNSVRLQIEEVQGRLGLLADQTALATISVQLSPPAPEPSASPSPSPTPVPESEEPARPNWADDAWDDAWETSEDILEGLGRVAITAGFVIVWVLVPLIVLAIAWRFWSRGGRREPAEPGA